MMVLEKTELNIHSKEKIQRKMIMVSQDQEITSKMLGLPRIDQLPTK